VPTRLNEVKDVDLLLKTIKCFLVQCSLACPPLVAFSLLKAATQSFGPLGGKKLEVGEEATDTVEYSGLDLPLVLQLDQVLSALHPVLGVELTKHRCIVREVLEASNEEADNEPDSSRVAAHKCQSLVETQQGDIGIQHLRALRKRKAVQAVFRVCLEVGVKVEGAERGCVKSVVWNLEKRQ